MSVLFLIAGTLTGCDQKGDTASSSSAGSKASSDPNRGVTGQPVTPKQAPMVTTSSAPASADKSPMDQSESPAQIAITAEIRKAIIADKNMSMNAQNCKIITDKAGVVTLRGMVNSQVERDAVEAKARAVSGVTRIDNLLEIKPA
jgi:osmotically-inducible protein OsmY